MRPCGSTKTQRDLLPSTTTASKLTIDMALRQLTGMYRIDRIVIVDRGILEECGGTHERPPATVYISGEYCSGASNALLMHTWKPHGPINHVTIPSSLHLTDSLPDHNHSVMSTSSTMPHCYCSTCYPGKKRALRTIKIHCKMDEDMLSVETLKVSDQNKASMASFSKCIAKNQANIDSISEW